MEPITHLPIMVNARAYSGVFFGQFVGKLPFKKFLKKIPKNLMKTIEKWQQRRDFCPQKKLHYA